MVSELSVFLSLLIGGIVDLVFVIALFYLLRPHLRCAQEEAVRRARKTRHSLKVLLLATGCLTAGLVLIGYLVESLELAAVTGVVIAIVYLALLPKGLFAIARCDKILKPNQPVN
jgi:small-conductance mechanosensitive channel